MYMPLMSIKNVKIRLIMRHLIPAFADMKYDSLKRINACVDLTQHEF